MIRRTVGTATRLPNNAGRHDLERHPATAYPHIQPLSARSGTVPSGTLAETEPSHTDRRRPPNPARHTQRSRTRFPSRSHVGGALVGADAEFVDTAEHLGRVGVDPVGPGPLEFFPAVPAGQ